MNKGTSCWDTAHHASQDHKVLQVSEIEPGIFVITMNTPENHNMLTPLMMGALTRAVDLLSAMEADQITAIILTAAGKSFCCGIDINSIRDEPHFEEYMTRDVDPFYALQECQVPVIACVRGAALTGGFELAMSCDIVIASQDAVFRDNHAMYGVHQIRGLSQLLPRLCGPSNAKLACLASLPVPASKALAWNIISDLVETTEHLLPKAMHIARGIAYNRGPILRVLKTTMDHAYQLSLAEARKVELSSDLAYFDELGDERSRVLTKGAERFNQRISELDSMEGMKGGMAEAE